MDELTERPEEPVYVTMLDGKQREVLLSMLSVKRIGKIQKKPTTDEYDDTDRAIEMFAEGFRLSDPDLAKDPDRLADLIDIKQIKFFRAAFERAMGRAQFAATEVSGAEPDPK